MDKTGIAALIVGIILVILGAWAIWAFLPQVIIAVEGLIGIVVLLAWPDARDLRHPHLQGIILFCYGTGPLLRGLAKKVKKTCPVKRDYTFTTIHWDAAVSTTGSGLSWKYSSTAFRTPGTVR